MPWPNMVRAVLTPKGKENQMKINVENIEKVNEAIKKAEKKATTRTVRYDQIVHAVSKAERKLHELEIPKKYWEACIISLEPDQVPNSYRGIAEGTFVDIIRYPSGWFVTYIGRSKTGSRSFGLPRRDVLILSTTAKEHIWKYVL